MNLESILIIYDGDCPLCNRSVRFIKKHQGKNPIEFVSRYHQDAQGYHPLETNSLLLIIRNNRYEKSTAALKISGLLKFPWNGLIVFLIVPPKWRDGVYQRVVRNRMRFFKEEHTCAVPD